MRATKSIVAAMLVMLLPLVAGSVSRAQEKPQDEQEKTSMWMKQKLEMAQNVLAGLTEGDFDKIKTSAGNMGFLGYLEKWSKSENSEYRRQLNFFDFANKELIRQAKAKNIDGALLAYNQLTASCVQCHKIVRDK